MNTFPTTPVPNPIKSNSIDEEKVLSADQATADSQALRSQAQFIDSKTKDQIALTELKKEYAGNVMVFLWFWFGALCISMFIYFVSQLTLSREIPKEVILGMLTSTAVVVGLVGYILKGLFGNNQ